MSNPKTLHNYTMMPFFIIGFSAFFAGFAWILAPEPWLLDESANTILLDESYENLFAADINRNLPDYLTLLYRFFGWWVSLIGLLTIGYTYVTRLGTHISRITIQIAYFIGLTGIGIILYTFIPTTPFVYLNIFLWAMWNLRGFTCCFFRNFNYGDCFFLVFCYRWNYGRLLCRNGVCSCCNAGHFFS